MQVIYIQFLCGFICLLTLVNANLLELLIYLVSLPLKYQLANVKTCVFIERFTHAAAPQTPPFKALSAFHIFLFLSFYVRACSKPIGFYLFTPSRVVGENNRSLDYVPATVQKR